VHGTIAVMPRDSFRVRSGFVDIHFLEPVPTEGLTYDDRNRLSRDAWDRMAAAMQKLYGVESVAETIPSREGAAAD
jgi:1-acyl-sn-glycerol-3-phosphate acyltransferase